MWCFWALPLLGLAVRVSSEETPPVSCNGTSMIVQPPLWVKMYRDEAHFICSSGYKLQGQNILSCINTNWNHPVPTCEKLPRVMIKMKCPFDHREWTLSNLNLISIWIDQNTDQVLILNSDYIDDSPESQRLAAEMLARFNDPFFRFYSKLPTTDKGRPIQRLIQRFQTSEEFLQLRNRMREDFTVFDFNDIDEDENVLLRYYGIHFAEVLEDIILPYSELITKTPETEKLTDLKLGIKHPKNDESDIRSTLATHDQDELEEGHESLGMEGAPSSTDAPLDWAEGEPASEGIVSTEQTLKKNVKRQKGDIEKLLPAQTQGKDLFNRTSEKLDGEKARQQTRMHRESYIDYLKTIVRHIIDHNIPRDKWPESLRQYDLDEISIVLQLPAPIIPVDPECPPPWKLGFELVSNGTANLQGRNRVVISCRPGFQLRGASELYCDRGRWVPRGAGMPTCVSSTVESQCDTTVPRLEHGRTLEVAVNYVLYKCLPGYTMRGSGMLVCENGRWAPRAGDSMPVCREIQVSNNCGPPPSPANGYAGEPHFMADGQRFVVRYFCERNYSMQGEDYSMCINGQWIPKNFRCVLGGEDSVPNNVELPQNPKICPKLVVPNASVKHYEDGASTVRVTCLPGYRMIGAGLIRCENGMYVDPIPRCMDRGAQDSCGPAVSPSHGSVQYITQSAVRFSCDSGYLLRGKDRATCYLGQWSDPTPECIPRAGCDNNDQLLNKNLVGYVYNNGRWLECVEKVEMIGNHHQYCRNGRWDSEPTCIMPDNAQKTSILYSEFIDCPLPDVSPSNDVTISSRGRKIYYRCKFQDSVLVGERSNECVGGRWRNPAPYCERRGVFVPPTTTAPFRGCSPRPIRGGDGYIYSEGRVVVYQCEINLLIRGQTSLRCERSQWSSPLPSCFHPTQSLILEDGEIISDSISCPPPPIYPGTSFRILNRGLRVGFTCPNGSTTIQECVDGRWSGGVPQCRPTIPAGVCEPQEIQNGKFFQYRRGIGYIQCKGNYVIENTIDSRSQDVRCDPDNGQWSFGLNPPKCVPEPTDIIDDRPYDIIEDSKWENRLQIEDCGPPEVSSKFTFYIQKDGRSIALGCKKPRTKRNVARIECLKGNWEYSASGICDSECGLDDVKIDNGVKVVYDENEYVFQCIQNYDLIGTPVAHCADYQPNAVYNTSFVQKFGPDFKAPECRRTESELRPISGDDVMESDALQPCRWLAEFGKLNLKPQDYFISDKGRVVTWRNEAKENTAVCQNGMWVNKASQTRGGCDSLPSEPEQGTFFLYEDARGTAIYFQCLDGYRLTGPRVSICGSARVIVPECIPDRSAPRGVYPKIKNPSPTSSVRCPRPPDFVPNADVTIHGSGEMFAINCNRGFLIENTRQRYSIIQCNQNAWDPETLPRCLRDGDRTPIPTLGTRRDLFGRRLPQDLTGEKARRQDSQLREQFRQHAQQLVDFAKARNRELRQSGVPTDRLPDVPLPIITTITDDEREDLFRQNEELYREIERRFQSIKEERVRARRQNRLQESTPGSDSQVFIPGSLLHLETLIKQYKLIQQDIDVLALLEESDRLKFLDDKKKQQEKSKSDPVRSQDFVRKAIAQKKRFAKKNSAEENQPKSTEVGNSIESLRTDIKEAPSSTEVNSTPATMEATQSTTEAAAMATTTTTTTAGPIESSSEAVTLNEVTEEMSTVEENAVTPSPNESAIVETTSSSSGARKGFDDSCSQQFEKAPEIENGFIVSYEVFEGKDGKSLQAKYRCDEGYYFAFEHTNRLRCRNGEWIGELPSCVPEPDNEEDEDQEEFDSELNKLK